MAPSRKMRRFLSRFRTLAALLVLLALAPAARADNPQRAKELFQEGTTFFDLGQFDKAIESWQAGYRERPDPGFLYNIAQAYRLAGDANKAIFFYKGYLRNAPKAHNRADVEEKIEALQQKVAADQKEGAKPAGTTPPGTATAAPPPGAQVAVAKGDAPGAQPAPAALQPPSSAPPGASAPPSQSLAMNGPTEPPPVVPQSVIGQEPPPIVRATLPPPVLAEPPPRLDLGFALGIDGWGNSAAAKTDPSLALSLSAGYIVVHTSSARHPFLVRVGGALGYTFLKEDTGRDTFLSALIVPAASIGLSPRVALFGEFGFGVLGLFGLKAGSPLLMKEMGIRVNGAQSMLEIRPALGLQFQITRAMGVFGEIASDYSPKAPHFYAPISRTEVLLGFSFRTLAI
jgi:hypothetical protein